jgi:hypothetical protein
VPRSQATLLCNIEQERPKAVKTRPFWVEVKQRSHMKSTESSRPLISVRSLPDERTRARKLGLLKALMPQAARRIRTRERCRDGSHKLLTRNRLSSENMKSEKIGRFIFESSELSWKKEREKPGFTRLIAGSILCFHGCQAAWADILRSRPICLNFLSSHCLKSMYKFLSSRPSLRRRRMFFADIRNPSRILFFANQVTSWPEARNASTASCRLAASTWRITRRR